MLDNVMNDFRFFSWLLEDDDSAIAEDNNVKSKPIQKDSASWNLKWLAPGKDRVAKYTTETDEVPPVSFSPPEHRAPKPIGFEIKQKLEEENNRRYSSVLKNTLEPAKQEVDHGQCLETEIEQKISRLADVLVVSEKRNGKGKHKRRKVSHAPPPVAPGPVVIGTVSKFSVLKEEPIIAEEEETMYPEHDEVKKPSAGKKCRKGENISSSFNDPKESFDHNYIFFMIDYFFSSFGMLMSNIFDIIFSILASVYSFFLSIVENCDGFMLDQFLSKHKTFFEKKLEHLSSSSHQLLSSCKRVNRRQRNQHSVKFLGVRIQMRYFTNRCD